MLKSVSEKRRFIIRGGLDVFIFRDGTVVTSGEFSVITSTSDEVCFCSYYFRILTSQFFKVPIIRVEDF